MFKLLGIEPVVVWSAPSAPAAEAWQAPAEPSLEPVPARITLANPGLPPPPGSGVAMPAAGQAAATDVTSDAPVSADLLGDAAGDVITADGQDRSRDAQMASAEARKVVTQRMFQSGVTEVPADSAGVVAAPMSAAAPLPAVLPQAAMAPPQPPLPLAEPDAAELLGERIDWLVADGAEEATIELHPAELGALSVRIQTRGDQAQVQFIVQDPATRQLLQQALPQLRELLGSSGIQLSRSRVETQSGRAVEAAETRAEPTVSRHRRVTGVVLVDAYI